MSEIDRLTRAKRELRSDLQKWSELELRIESACKSDVGKDSSAATGIGPEIGASSLRRLDLDDEVPGDRESSMENR